jgi:drug/metabolite transporter (DMT)-like permease
MNSLATVPRLSPEMLRGILMMALGMTLVPMLDVCAKILSETIPLTQIVWARFATSTLMLLPLIRWRYPQVRLRQLAWRWQVPRAIFMVLATLGFFGAIREMPIPDALALAFVYPILVTLAASFLLKESVGWARWLASGVGFIGVLVILRPGFGVFQPEMLYALGAGATFAAYVVVTRRMKGSDPPLVTLTCTSGLCALGFLATFPLGWVAPTWSELALMIGVGFFGSAGHYFLIRALDYAPASLLAPFGYFEMVSSVILSYLVFSTLPDALTFLGIAIIVCSGIVLSRLENSAHGQ